MHSDVIDAEYYTERLQTSLDMAAHSVNIGAMMAHEGLASCYRAKLATLNSAKMPRAVLSLAAFRGKKQADDFQLDRPGLAASVSAAAVR